MALPSILNVRRRKNVEGRPSTQSEAKGVQEELRHVNATKPEIRKATKVRRIVIAVAAFAFVMSVIFNLLVVIGNLNVKQPVLTSIYFFKLDLTDIIPTSVPNANLINSIARTIGLHDFYQVGMWNFCEGYLDEGVTDCSTPQNFYWFNPVDVLTSELLAGATIALPTAVIEILNVLRLASQIMFGFFITGLIMNFVLIFIAPVALLSHWWSLPVALAAFVSSVLVFCAAVVGTVISLAFKYAAESQADLNISADVGVPMFAFMWLAFGFAWLAFALHAGMGCCCTSVRDVKTGRRPIVRSPEPDPEPVAEEVPVTAKSSAVAEKVPVAAETSTATEKVPAATETSVAAEGPAVKGPAAEGPAAEGPAAEGLAAEGPGADEAPGSKEAGSSELVV